MEYELKRWKEKFADGLFEALSRAEVSGCLSGWIPSPYTKADAQSFIKARMYADDEKELCRALVADSKPVGSVELYRREGCFSQTASLFFWIDNSLADESMTADALKTLCSQAITQFGVSRIEALAYADDLPARAALNDAGFELEGIMRKCILVDGELKDRCVYALVEFELFDD